MDVDSIRIEKLTKEEREKCIREGRCLRCRKLGHYSRNCTTFQSNNTNPYTQNPPRKPQEPRKVAKIEEVLEVQQGEEVSDEEELVAKLYVQDF